MATWGAFRDGTLRILLADPPAISKFKNPDLLSFMNLAIIELSQYGPAIKQTALTPTGTTYQFALPADMLALYAVRWDQYILDPLDITKYPVPNPINLGSEPISYLLHWPTEGYITFIRIPKVGTNLAIRYGSHRTPLAGDSDAMPFGPYRWMEEAAAHYVGYLAHVMLSVGRASLEQWSERPENVVGNPLADEAKFFLDQYRRVVNENRGHGAR
jgi:hypothetical protein